MRSPQEVRDMQVVANAGKFTKLAKCLAMAGVGGLPMALKIAQETRAADEVVEVLRTAVAAGTTTGNDYAALVTERLGSAWLASNSYGSLLDTALEGAMNVPLRQAIVVVSGGGAIGSEVHETDARPMFALALDTQQGIEELQVVAMVAVSAELLRIGGPLADQLINGELSRALRRAQDRATLFAIAPNASPAEIDVIAALGTTPTLAMVDLRKLVEALTTDASSRILLGVSPTRAKRMALWTSTTNEPAFPGMTIQGGQIAGMAVVVSDRIADDEVIGIDCSGLAGNGGVIIPDLATHASIQFESQPANPTIDSTVMVNLWQRNLRALRLTRKFGIKRIRAGSVAKLDNVVWNNPA